MDIKMSYKLIGVFVVVIAMVVSPFLVPTLSSSSNAPSVTIAHNSDTKLIGCTKFTAHGSKDSSNIIYVHVYVYFNSSSNSLIYLSEQQISAAGPCTSWELAGGLGTKTSHPTWTVMSTLQDPSYSSRPPSSCNPTSYWAWNPWGFWIDTPANTVTCGKAATVSVTAGLTAGVSASASEAGMGLGASLSASYAVTCTFTEPEFLVEPIYQGSCNNSWYYSDNQGYKGSAPYSATVFEGSVIHAVTSSYNSMWVRDWGHFVVCGWFGPSFDVAYGNTGAIYYIS